MPQIEKITYITTTYWILISYFAVYLDLIVTYLYKFLTSLKLDWKRLALKLTKALRWNLNQYIIRQWSKQPLIINIIFLIWQIDPVKKKHVNPYKRPADHNYFYEYLAEADKWFLYWTGTFSPDQWMWTIPTIYVIYIAVIGNIYNYFAFKWFSGTWLTLMQRIMFITLDIILNCIFGPISLIYPHTFLYKLVMKCPVSISPIFLFVELIVFTYVKSLVTQILSIEGLTPRATLVRECKTITVWFVRAAIYYISFMVVMGTIGRLFCIFIGHFIGLDDLLVKIFMVLATLSIVIISIIFLMLVYYVRTGKWVKRLNSWKEKINNTDNAIAAKYKLIREIFPHIKNDLERELDKKPKRFENIYFSIYKFFNKDTWREKYAEKLRIVNMTKTKPPETLSDNDSFYTGKTNWWWIFKPEAEATREVEALLYAIVKKIFKI